MELTPDKWLVFDLEATGPNPEKDKIVQVSTGWVNPDWTVDAETFLVNPAQAIPQDSIRIHHITDDMVKDQPLFKTVAPELLEKFKKAKVLIAYNVGFDLQLMNKELTLAGLPALRQSDYRFLDPYLIWVKSEPRRLGDAAKKFLGESPENLHDAEQDSRITVRVLKAMVEGGIAIPDQETAFKWSSPIREGSVTTCGRLKWRDDGEMMLSFGQFKGRTLRALAEDNREYLKWILRGDFSEEVKQIVRDAMDGNFRKQTP